MKLNYRSRAPIVELYTHFIEQTDWTRPGPTPAGGTGYFRLHDKGIRAHRPQDGCFQPNR